MDNKQAQNKVADGVGLTPANDSNHLECQPAIRATIESTGEFSPVSNLPIRFEAGYPPNIDAIAKVLPGARGKAVIFTYGHTIYVANGKPIPKSLIAHECVHVQQQDMFGRDEWWDRYLRDKKFRFQMELAAHRMELTIALTEGSRHHRRMVTKAIAKRLSGPLYGKTCTLTQARKMLGVTNDNGA